MRRSDPITAPLPAPLSTLDLGRIIRALWPYIRAYASRVVLALLALILAKIATLGMPWALKHIIDGVDRNLQTEVVLPLAFLLIYGTFRFSTVFFAELRDALFSRVTEHAIRQVGLRVFKHLHQLDLSFHLERQTGGVSRDIERGTGGIQFLMRFLMLNIVPTLLEIMLVAVIFAVAFSPWYALIMLVAVASYIYFTIRVTEWRTQFVRQANLADSSTNTRAVDSLLNYETVKYFNNEDYEAQVYDEYLKTWERAKLRNRSTLLALNTGQAFIIAAAMTIMLTMAAQSVVDRSLTLGDLAMINAYLLQLFIPLNFLGVIYREIRRALTDLENMLGLLEIQPKIQDTSEAQSLRITGGRIEFRAVGFSYHPERSVLNDVSFHVEPGTKVAIVGASGSGKTTLTRLLYRFYDVNEGQILIDGQDIRDCTLSSLRSAIAVVPQDMVLFNASIRDNVAYGELQAPAEMIDRAMSMAQLDDLIQELPEGDQTLVGERGLKVSGGEKQRISLARAILKKAPILIFDEATSALDSHSETIINQAIKTLTPNHTTLVIAHRLSTITDADQIIVMANGSIVERGTHQQLLAHSGQYAALWQAQIEQNQHKI